MSQIHIGSMASVVDDQNVLWMSNVFFNGLFRMDLDSQEIRCIGAFEGVDLSAEELHKGAHINGEEIIFTPFYDRAVRIYHRGTNTYQTIEVPEEHKPPFSESTRIGQHIFFLSEDGCIWNYDIEKHSLTVDEMSKEYQKFLDTVGGGISTTVDAEGFLLLKRGDGMLCRINLVKHESEMISVDGNPTNLQAALYGAGLYWFFLSDSQDIVSWDRETSAFVSYKCREEKWGKDWGKDRGTYLPYSKSGAVFQEDTVWISNYNALFPVRIDKDKKSVEAIAEDIEGLRVIDPYIWGPIYPNAYNVGEDIYFVPCHANLLLCYQHESGTVRGIELAVSQEKVPYFDEIVKERWKSGALKEREELYTLEGFIKNIIEGGE